MSDLLLQVKDLKVQFNTDRGLVTAVNGVNFEVYKGKTLGIVGESGSGKSVSALSVMRLIPTPPGRISSGEINFKGQNLLNLPMDHMRSIRGNKIGMIFQEPMTALNPVFTVGNQIDEVLTLHQSELTKVIEFTKELKCSNLLAFLLLKKDTTSILISYLGG